METKNFLQNVPLVKLSYVDAEYRERQQIRCSTDINNIISPFFESVMQHHEEAYGILLSRQNRVLGVVKLGEGALSEVTVNKAAFFQAMILSNAAGCIFVHNHPSGQARPSREDDKLTSELKAGMLLLGYSFFDHLIITSDEYFSYADEGRL